MPLTRYLHPMTVQRFDSVALPEPLAGALRYAHYDMLKITVARDALDRRLRDLARRFPGHSPIPEDEVRALFEAAPAPGKPAYEAFLTGQQYSKLMSYLCRNSYYEPTPPAAPVDSAPEFLLAFSYGAAPDVNREIAAAVAHMPARPHPAPPVYAQAEVAEHLAAGARPMQVRALARAPGEDYITTDAVIRKFIEFSACRPGARIHLACQAWHAPRCRRLCENSPAALRVVAGTFIDLFSPDDPQPWVRDALSWVIKESAKD